MFYNMFCLSMSRIVYIFVIGLKWLAISYSNTQQNISIKYVSDCGRRDDARFLFLRLADVADCLYLCINKFDRKTLWNIKLPSPIMTEVGKS